MHHAERSGQARNQGAKDDPWHADIEIGEELAARLIGRQFPELAPIEIRQLGEGWDNVAFEVDGTYVFRFPRRIVAAKLIELEMRALPLIEGRLPLPISAPSFIGRSSSEEYPWPFAGYRRLDGAPLSEHYGRTEAPADDLHGALATSLGTFLRALHSIDSTQLFAAGLRQDEIGRFDYDRTIEKLSTRLRELESDGVVQGADSVLAFAQGLQPIEPRHEYGSLVHGDIYARHVLVDERLRPTGIIDWGDMHFGDPAIDLTIAFGTIPPSARDRFFDAYGAVDETGRRLARYRAIYSSTVLAHYGHRIGDRDLLCVGLRGLRLAQN